MKKKDLQVVTNFQVPQLMIPNNYMIHFHKLMMDKCKEAPCESLLHSTPKVIYTTGNKEEWAATRDILSSLIIANVFEVLILHKIEKGG